MKKINVIICSSLACLFLCMAGCSKKNSNPATDIQKVESEYSLADAGTENDLAEYSGIPDRDLTVLNKNMVYAEVFNMMIDPDSYSGKYLKMKGGFKVYENTPLGTTSYAVIISDALACCQTGIEFLYDFEDKLPDIDSEVTVTGRFITAELPNGLSYNYVKALSVE